MSMNLNALRVGSGAKVFWCYCLRALLCLAVLYVALVTAWVGDDAQITFRQVWNFVHGDGMTFNYGERVQAFTHPAWFFLLSAVVAATGDLHLSAIVLSIALSVVAVIALLAAERQGGLAGTQGAQLKLLTPALLLLFSTAFCDYMTSGLENPLSYFLVGMLMWLIAANGNGQHRQWLFLLLALLVLNRPDYAVLFLPLALLLTADAYRASGLRGFVRDVWPGALLLLAWFGFALLYFGSPLPNTFYAKMGADTAGWDTLKRGLAYYWNALHRDPASLLIIAAGLALAALRRHPALLALAAGQLLYMGFILYAGGDFMQGRFFALPVFLSVGLMILALNHSPERGSIPPRFRRAADPADGAAIGGLRATGRRFGRVSLNTLRVSPVSILLLLTTTLGLFTGYPFLATPAYDHPISFYGAMDERGFWYQRYGLLAPKRNWPQVVTQPDEPPQYAAHFCVPLGLRALTSPDIHLVDRCALSDPFLARLPSLRAASGPGHEFRKLPTNYIAYLVGKAPTVADEKLRGLLHDVSLAARAPALFTRERLAALWRLNTGYHSGLDLSKYSDPAIALPMSTEDVRHTVPLPRR